MKKAYFIEISLLILILVISILNLTIGYSSSKGPKLESELVRLYKIEDRVYSLKPKGNGAKIVWGTVNYPMTSLCEMRNNEIDLRKMDVEKVKLTDYETVPLFITKTNFRLGEKEYKFNVIIDNRFQLWLDPDYNFNNSILKGEFWRITTLFGIQTFEELLDGEYQDKLDNSSENNTIGPFVFNPG